MRAGALGTVPKRVFKVFSEASLSRSFDFNFLSY